MKPASFELHRPESVEAVIELLDSLESAELMAGNQSLGILMSNRLATPDHVIDLDGVSELTGIELADDVVHLGAMTCHRTIERSDLLADRLELLPESAAKIAGPAVRNRGTLGGSLAEADPAGNYPTALTALDATVHVRSSAGSREIPVGDFHVGYMFTALAEDELVERVTVPLERFPADRTGMAFVSTKPAAQAFPTISAAATVTVEDPTVADPVVESAGLAIANVADVPLSVPDVIDAVQQSTLDDETLARAGEAAAAAAEPVEEDAAEATFKRELAGEFTKRSLKRAVERAGT